MNIITDLFSRNKTETTKNAVQLNDVKTDPLIVMGWDTFGIGEQTKKFADFFLWLVVEKIYKGINNVTFSSRKDDRTANDIVTFIEKNAMNLIHQMINYGYIAVSYTDTGFGYKYSIKKQADIRKDGYGRVLNVNTVVIYAPIYQLQRKTDILMVKPTLDLINTFCNASMNCADTLGTLPIIWGNSIPANPKFKEELESMMSKKYGWDVNKFRYFLSHQEVHVEQIDLKIKDLELRDNIKNALEYLLNYFGVPADLVIGNSTYNNVAEAKKFFYDTTIRSWSETLLKVARGLLTKTGDFLPQNTLTYRFENIPELETTLSSACEEKNAYIDTLLKLKEAGIDVSDELNTVFQDVKKTYIEV